MILAGSEFFKTVEIEVYRKDFHSAILNTRMITNLNVLCDLELSNWTLIYKASRDGYNAIDFHSNKHVDRD